MCYPSFPLPPPLGPGGHNSTDSQKRQRTSRHQCPALGTPICQTTPPRPATRRSLWRTWQFYLVARHSGWPRTVLAFGQQTTTLGDIRSVVRRRRCCAGGPLLLFDNLGRSSQQLAGSSAARCAPNLAKSAFAVGSGSADARSVDGSVIAARPLNPGITSHQCTSHPGSWPERKQPGVFGRNWAAFAA